MATLNIEGRNVTVDDSFLKLPPDQQHATVDEIAKSIGVKPGNAESGLRGALQGATLNFSDEMAGLRGASGLSDEVKAAVPFSGEIVGGVRKLLGSEGAREGYDASVAREREANRAAQQAHPLTYTAGEIAGSLPLPVGAGATAATLPARLLSGAVTGGVVGGLSGLGGGETPTERATGAAVGGVGGALIGAAAPVVVEGVTQGARALAQPIANTIRGLRRPDDEAARRVAVALDRDIQADPNAANRLTAPEFAASVQNNGPASIMDIGGETTRALARSAANTSPEGRQTLNNAINNRFEGQSDRVTGWLRNAFNFPDAAAQQEALTQTARNVNRANYRQALQEGDRSIISPELERLLGAPAVVDAMKKAATSGKDRAITQGLGAFNPSVTVENGTVLFRPGKGGVPTYPNLAFWDATKRELDDAARAAGRAGRNGEAQTLGDLSRSLRNELDAAVPSYATARAGAAHFFGAQDALEAGQNFVARNMSSDDARRAMGQMSPTERQLFQDGFVSRFIDTLNQTGDRRTILNKIAESPAAREKLNLVLGTQRAQELEAGLRVEGVMDLARGAVQGNSTTARQLAELGLAGGAYGVGSGGDLNPLHHSPGSFATAVTGAVLAYGAARGKGHIDANVARRVAEMLASNDPQVIQRGVQIVAHTRTLFNAFRAADQGLARIGGSQAPIAPALQAAGISRAQDQQNVPRPPGQ